MLHFGRDYRWSDRPVLLPGWNECIFVEILHAKIGIINYNYFHLLTFNYQLHLIISKIVIYYNYQPPQFCS